MSNSKPLLIGGTVIVLFLFLQIGLVRGETLDLADIQLIKDDIIDTKDINEKDIAIAYKGLPYKINPEKQEKIIGPDKIEFIENGQTKYKIFTGYTFYEENGTYYEVEHATSTITDYDSIIRMDISKANVFDFFTTKEANADNTTYASAGDGVTYRTTYGNTFADLRNGAGESASYTGTTLKANWNTAGESSTAFYALYRIHLPFNTSFSGEVATATLFVYGDSKADSNSWNPTLNVFESTMVADDSLSATDHVRVGTTVFSSAISYADFNTSGYNEFVLNEDGIANINSDSYTKFSLREAYYDAGGNTPSWISPPAQVLFRIYASEETGTNKDPYLLLEMATSPESGTGTSTTIVMDEPWYSDDLTIIKGKTEIFTDSTTTPSETRYHYYHLPFLGWAIIAVAFIIIGNRVLLEFIIRFRK